VLHIDGFSFVSAGDEAAVSLAMERARAAGCLVSADGAVPAAARHTDFLRHLFSQADLVFANAFEGMRATDTDTVEDATQAFQRMGPKAVFLKLGPHGALVITQDGVHEIPGYEVEVADTVAAGDAFIATTLLGLLSEATFVEAATSGSAAGALACGGLGSLSSRFDLKDVERLVARGPKMPIK
jgi:sugar/nucleoside kinase (ribokinase family)